jgi:hypothetical protein
MFIDWLGRINLTELRGISREKEAEYGVSPSIPLAMQQQAPALFKRLIAKSASC